MGFDIECIIDIHTYPGEYFCPVCRTLVYPNEAFQSQCTHLYCKPCLAHIASGSRACPYDGYLVTESDSKPLMESDKALAENIGKVKVHCLYFRSGCAWEGTLSNCSSHCSSCSFGNSPVICNRCGIQIIHRQVHEHAQTCPGVYEGQQAVGGASGLVRSGTTASSAVQEVNQTVAQSGAPSQPQNSQNVGTTTVVGQNPSLQANASSQTPAAAPVAAPTSDQWYQQQQYQQYYQQHMGYEPYQQPNQQYYAVQSYQQYQQHPVQVPDQHQSQGYSQAIPQPHFQTQLQPQAHPPQVQPQPQPQPQPQLQPQPLPVSQATSQPHLQKQAQAQPQLQLPPQVQPQVQVPPQAQVQGHTQGPAPNYQGNPQQPPNPLLRPQNQIAPQALPPPPPPPPPPQNHSAHPPQYGQVIGMRPPTQNSQVPPYQQPHPQMHHYQASQAHVQPQLQPQAQPQSQSQPQPQNLQNVQIQPQVQPYLTHSQAPVFPPQANQSSGPTPLPHAPHPPLPVSGHHSYQPPHPAQQMQPGSSQQFAMHPHPKNVSLHPTQPHGQVPQQLAAMRPPSQAQQPSVLLPHNQVPGMPPTQQHPFTPQVPQPSLANQNHPPTQPLQQALPQQYAQQQYPGPLQNQLHQQGHSMSMQKPVLCPYATLQPQQSQSYVGRPMMSNHGIHSQSHPFLSDIGPLAQSGHSLLSSAPKVSVNENYVKSTVLEHNANGEETRSPLKGHAEKHLEGDILKEELVTGQSEKVVSGSDKAVKDVLSKSVKQEEEYVHGSLDQSFGGNSVEAGAAVGESSKVEVNSVADSDSLNQVNLENKVNLSVVMGPSSAPYDNRSHAAPSVSANEGLLFSQQPYGSHHQRSDIQEKGQPPFVPGAQGPLALAHHGQSLNPSDGSAPGYYGPPPKRFESQSKPPGAATTTPNYSHGIPGRPLPIAGNQSGSGESTLMKTLPDEPSILGMNGGTSDSMLASKDEKLKPFPREHLNPYPLEPNQPFNQASRSFDKAAHGPIHDPGLNMNPGAMGAHSGFLPPHNNVSGGPGHMDMFGVGPDFGQQQMKHFALRSPGREYFGSSPRGFGGPSFPRGNPNFDDLNSREPLRYGEGSRSFNLSGQVGNPFRDGRFPAMSGPPRVGDDIDGSGNPRFGDDVFGPDHFGKGKFSGPEYLSGQFNMGESAGPGALPGYGRASEIGDPVNFHRLPFTDSIRGDRHNFAHFGEPPMQNNYPLPGFPNAGRFSSGIDSFEPRKRKHVSTGWCRICEIDCDSVEGLDLHSQTREHQKMAMDIVKSIKMQNKKQRAGGRMAHGGRNRRTGIVGR